MITLKQFKEIVLTGLVIAVIGCFTAHLTLLALDKQADNQAEYIDEYNARIDGEIKDVY